MLDADGVSRHVYTRMSAAGTIGTGNGAPGLTADFF